ncbi:MAG: hypothetical protein JW810_03660 [Sedimentisphaerales bacterium]|nr:hypothetical protein [Sedimentisphaerales bacterium]
MMNQTRIVRTIALVLGLLVVSRAGSARAEFVCVEDFESLAPGNIDDQGDWQAAGDSSSVAADPADPANQVLRVTTESTIVHRPLLIAEGTTRMLFFRFRYASQMNVSFGLSDVAAPDQFGHFEVELSMRNAIPELKINNDGRYDGLISPDPNNWYNVWLRIDNTEDTTEVWFHGEPWVPADAGDSLHNVAGETVFTFRNGGGSSNLVTFYIKTGSGNSENSGPLYIDDIYLEDTDALNLDNPTRCPADFEPDGDVDLHDYAVLAAAWSSRPGDDRWNALCELAGGGDPVIDLADLRVFCQWWLACGP